MIENPFYLLYLCSSGETELQVFYILLSSCC